MTEPVRRRRDRGRHRRAQPPPVSIGRVSEDVDLLPEPEKARVKARDRKVRGPKVVVDNAGLRKVQMQLAERRRAAAKAKPEGPTAQ